MPRPPDPGARKLVAVSALASGFAAAIGAHVLRGFTVDDAWIPARYAAHLATGVGYRFNADGAVTDGVTPLPWVPLLVALSRGGKTMAAMLATARTAGVVAWIVAAALLGAYAAGAGTRRVRFVPLIVLASAPLAAWSVAGLETGVVTALATVSVVAPRSRRGAYLGAIAAGLAAAFRPEMAPFAAVIGLGRAFQLEEGKRAGPFVCSVIPWFAVLAIRYAWFGKTAPLALAAKPSDLTHGVVYVVAGVLLGGAPVLTCAPRALLTDSELTGARWIVLAAFGHVTAVALAGGDWMPLSRLLCPIFPPLTVVAIQVAERAPWRLTVLRAVLAAAGMTWAWVKVGPSARTVWDTRTRLVESARPELASSRVVAALDVGWVSASTEDTVVDLAGLTDPAIAVLPGGHTSKQVPATLLDARGVDTIVLLRGKVDRPRDDGGPFDRAVEERIATDRWVTERFEPAAILRAGELRYVVFKRKAR